MLRIELTGCINNVKSKNPRLHRFAFLYFFVQPAATPNRVKFDEQIIQVRPPGRNRMLWKF